MNVAVIFAGGSGTRMNTKDKPKQFLMVHGKPIIVHTIEIFERHPDIDGIIVVCIENWIEYMEEMKYRYRLDKIGKIVAGGENGQMSIYHGLCAAKEVDGCGSREEMTNVLVHDGGRPMVDEDTIMRNNAPAREKGSAITCAPAKETFVLVDNQEWVTDIPDRARSRVAKAPQSFFLDDILKYQNMAIEQGERNMIDSCTLMRHFNVPLAIVDGSYENIKITTPDDFYMFRALYDARENQQLE